MPYFIDTNIFLRTLYKEYPQKFLECTNLFKSIRENKIDAATGTICLTEVAYTLKTYYKFRKEKIIEGIRSIININGLKIIDNYNQELALDIFEKYSVKFTDALIASSEDIYSRKMTVVSYDRDFDKLPILYREPSEIKIK